MNTTLDFLKEEGSLVGYSLITKPDEAVLKEMVCKGLIDTFIYTC
jgi:hypothetical protein